jgi:hypothetical protein
MTSSSQISLVATSGIFSTNLLLASSSLRFLVDMFGGFSTGKCHQRPVCTIQNAFNLKNSQSHVVSHLDSARSPTDNGNCGCHKKRKCGQSFNSMHHRASLDHSVCPFFLFFDHQPQNGAASGHHFVCTKDTRKLEYGKYRQIIANFPPDFEQPRFEQIREGDLVKYKKLKRQVIVDHEGSSIGGQKQTVSRINNPAPEPKGLN